MSKTVKEIAEYLNGAVIGNASLVINGLSGLKEAQGGDLSFVANDKYLPLIKSTQASAILVERDFHLPGKTFILTENPSLAFAKIVPLFIDAAAERFTGIHPTVVLGKNVKLGKDVAIGPYTVLEDNVTVGDNTVIYSGCFIGHHSQIGAGGLFYPRVTIRERSKIGERVIVHSGAVIGSDGFGFVNVNRRHEKIPQIGTVEIEDDVEIGANVTIDRARFDKTFIGRGTKIDNLVQIAHNVHIGENCIIVSQVGISGSNRIENNVTLAGQAGLAGHLTIGEGSVVAAQAGVVSSIPPNSFVSGYPAKPHAHAKRVNACVQRLPLYIKQLQDMKKKISELEEKLGLDVLRESNSQDLSSELNAKD